MHCHGCWSYKNLALACKIIYTHACKIIYADFGVGKVARKDAACTGCHDTDTGFLVPKCTSVHSSAPKLVKSVHVHSRLLFRWLAEYAEVDAVLQFLLEHHMTHWLKVREHHIRKIRRKADRYKHRLQILMRNTHTSDEDKSSGDKA